MARATEFDKAVGARLRLERERRGISQDGLTTALRARGVPWHQTALSRTEIGERPLRLSEAVEVAAILAVPLDELIRDQFDGRRSQRVARAIAELEHLHEDIGDRLTWLKGQQ